MSEIDNSRRFGWRRDLPDFRDFTVNHKELSSKLKAIGNQQPIQALLKQRPRADMEGFAVMCD